MVKLTHLCEILGVFYSLYSMIHLYATLEQSIVELLFISKNNEMGKGDNLKIDAEPFFKPFPQAGNRECEEDQTFQRLNEQIEDIDNRILFIFDRYEELAHSHLISEQDLDIFRKIFNKYRIEESRLKTRRRPTFLEEEVQASVTRRTPKFYEPLSVLSKSPDFVYSVAERLTERCLRFFGVI